ncbi:hypothetical protein Peur_005827 [Populus x canadensis]
MQLTAAPETSTLGCHSPAIAELRISQDTIIGGGRGAGADPAQSPRRKSNSPRSSCSKERELPPCVFNFGSMVIGTQRINITLVSRDPTGSIGSKGLRSLLKLA